MQGADCQALKRERTRSWVLPEKRAAGSSRIGREPESVIGSVVAREDPLPRRAGGAGRPLMLSQREEREREDELTGSG